MAKILIVDDDPDIVEAMKVVLESKKYQVAVAKSGEECLKKVKLQKSDLIILDTMMETGDKGFDIARELKKDEDYKDNPIEIAVLFRLFQQSRRNHLTNI